MSADMDAMLNASEAQSFPYALIKPSCNAASRWFHGGATRQGKRPPFRTLTPWRTFDAAAQVV
eukprot:6665617-Pyramimonas_sp.AAC.1